jgi:hypothetical protein
VQTHAAPVQTHVQAPAQTHVQAAPKATKAPAVESDPDTLTLEE